MDYWYDMMRKCVSEVADIVHDIYRMFSKIW